MKKFFPLTLLVLAVFIAACTGNTPTPAKGGKPAPNVGVPLSQSGGGSSLSGAAIKAPAVPSNCTPASNLIDTANAAAYMEQVIQLTNVERGKVQAAALSLNSNLRDAAQAHAMDMACRQYFEHSAMSPAPYGVTPFERMTTFGYAFSAAAENIAAGQQTPADVVLGWMNSPGHKTNMLNPTYTQIGIGYVWNKNDELQTNYFHYWVMKLGKPQ
jgi:uncharacterized protein YkwD